MVKVQDKEVMNTKTVADIKAKCGTVNHMGLVR